MDKIPHIDKAVGIIYGIINEDLSIFEARVAIAFNVLNLPRDLDLDQLLSSAKRKAGFYYVGKNYQYDPDKSGYDNLQNWAHGSKNGFNWEEINDAQKSLFWEALGKSSFFEKDYGSVFVEFEKDFFYHINKSLLNAEYLFLDNYKQKVQECANKLLENKIERPIKSYKVPHFVKSFVVIASHLCDLCWRIDNAIDGSNNRRRINIETHSEEKANRLELRFTFRDKSPKHDILFHFTQSVIEMTAVDHIYKASSENIGKLIALWDRIKDVEEEIDYEELSDMVRMVKFKTATLLGQMLKKWRENARLTGLENVDFFYSAGTENNIDINEKIESSQIQSNLNATINRKNSFKDKKSSLEDYPESIIENISVSNDIRRYNDWVKRGQDYYCDKSELVGKIIESKSNQSQDLDGIIKDISSFNNVVHKDRSERYSPFYFLLVLDFIDTKYEENNNNESVKIKLLELLHSTLDCLKEYINTYENRMPPVFRPYFEYSFYKLDNNNCCSLVLGPEDIGNYEIDGNFADGFFFASYECNAISINRLKEKYEKYIVLVTSWSSEISQSLQDKSSRIEASIKEQKKQIDDQIKKIEEKIEEQKKDAADQKTEIKRTQQSSLQTLGLFTGFLAFIVTSIGTFRVANNLAEYIIYSLTYTLAIALFAFLISDRRVNLFENANNNEGTNDRKLKVCFRHLWEFCIGNGKAMVFGLIFIVLLLFATIYFCNRGFGSSKEANDDANELHTTIDNSSKPCITLELQSVFRDDTLKSVATNPVDSKNNDSVSNSMSSH